MAKRIGLAVLAWGVPWLLIWGVIKTAAGQIKRTEIPDGEEPVLEQAFVHNEFINNFDEPLAQRHDGLRDDVVKKILAIPAKMEKASDTDEDA